ncbi:SDR family oxidoreductase [Streptomyces cynarae]|uniref:SDR family oxidoreductase n=1 Tax=Streptomyces cynarae TaxID=2981134 RepID=A0ABY6DZL0_9ACTN|nr:SDR family oxidoreductase [Streptomyces cynarae]UXY18986.1 SDR family oxidoreductase [Streptomyces cynarae]
MADAVLFLASSESSCTTGATLPVDGGHTAPGRVRKVPPAPRRLARSPRGGPPIRRTERKPKYVQYQGFRPARREHAPPRRRGARPPGGRRDFADTT